MAYRFKVIKEGLQNTVSEVTRGSWLSIAAGIITAGLVLFLVGDYNNAFQVVVYVPLGIISIIFIWSLYDIIEDYGKLKFNRAMSEMAIR